jgi:hypothetical protein
LCQLAYGYTIDLNLMADAWNKQKAQAKLAYISC